MDLLLELERRCQLTPVMGNHELMMLRALNDLGSLRFWLECGGMVTVESYGGGMEIPEPHLAFLHRCCRFVETEGCIFLHANYDAELPLEVQPDRLLFWEHVFSTARSAFLRQDRDRGAHAADVRRDSRPRTPHLHRHALRWQGLAHRPRNGERSACGR